SRVAGGLPRAEARDQGVNLPLPEPPERGGRQPPPQVLLEQDRLSWRLRLRPAGIRILLVLLSHLARDVVLDRRQRRNRRPPLPLFGRLAHLLHENGGDRLRPSSVQPPLRPRAPI